MNRSALSTATALALFNTAGACWAQGVADVAFSRAPGSPTSVVPGALDADGEPVEVRFLSMLDFWLSPDGSRFILRGATDAVNTLESYALIGSATESTLFMQEGQTFPGAVGGEVVDFVGNSVGYPFNTNNEWAYNLRARGGSTGVFNKILRFDSSGEGQLRFQGGNSPAIGSPYTGVTDINTVTNPSGDETLGNSTQCIHLLNDGRIGWRDDTVLNLHSSRRPITAYDAAKFRQVFIDSVITLDGAGSVPISDVASNSTISVFLTSPDGSVAVLRGAIDTNNNGTSTGDPNVVIVNDQVRIQVGLVIPNTPVTPTSVNQTFVAANNDWYARGADANGAWATRNGAIIAKTGDALDAGTWGPTFYTIAGSSTGSWVIAGKSSVLNTAVDDIVAIDGQVVLREGDPVNIDLDGDGDIDPAFIGRGNNTLAAFQLNNSAGLAPDGTLYILASLRDAAGADLAPAGVPYALLRLAPQVPPTCLADFNGDGLVFPDDLSEFITCFFLQVQFPGFCPRGDFNGDGLVFPDDLSEFITNFFLTVAAGGC